MGDETHVRLVDAHAEGDGRDDDNAVFAEESVLVAPAGTRVEPGVVRKRIHADPAQPLGRIVDLAPGQAVHDAGVAPVAFLEKAPELRLRIVLRDDLVADVRAIEAAYPEAGIPQAQPFDDLAARGLVGRRGERDPGNPRKVLTQDRQLHVFGAEVVAPLGDAVGLVDRDEGEAAAGEQLQGALAEQAFRGDIEQIDRPGLHRPLDLQHLAVREGRIEARRPHAGQSEPLDLVAHECDERRDHHAHTVPDDRRDLIAEGFAPAGRHQDQAVTSGDRVADDLFLLAQERGVPENAVEDTVDVAGHVRCVGRLGRGGVRGTAGRSLQCNPRTR